MGVEAPSTFLRRTLYETIETDPCSDNFTVSGFRLARQKDEKVNSAPLSLRRL